MVKSSFHNSNASILKTKYNAYTRKTVQSTSLPDFLNNESGQRYFKKKKKIFNNGNKHLIVENWKAAHDVSLK